MREGDPIVIRRLAGGAPLVAIFASRDGRWVSAYVDDGDQGTYVCVDVDRVEPCPRAANA